VAGGLAYLNPGGDPEAHWKPERLPADPDVYLSLPAAGERALQLVGASSDRLVSLRRAPSGVWRWRVLGDLPPGRTQGYTLLPPEAGRAQRAALTRGNNLLLVEPPAPGSKAPWRTVFLTGHVEEEGVAAADLDGDGDFDLAAHRRDGDAHTVFWLENRETEGRAWAPHVVATGERWLDRIAAGDVDGDGRVDLVSTEESRDLERNAQIYWFRAPDRPREQPWTRNRIATLRSVNSLDLVDVDRDGDLDVVVAEHTDFTSAAGAVDNLTAVYENVDGGSRWVEHVVERGPHSSHLGARTVDLDGDGDLDIVSIAWRQFTHVHAWRNDAPAAVARIAGARQIAPALER